MKFWGVAFTMRCVPANRPMWKLNTTEEIVNAHGIWFKGVGNIGGPSELERGAQGVAQGQPHHASHHPVPEIRFGHAGLRSANTPS